jgi:protein O-mannosyl-transferase
MAREKKVLKKAAPQFSKWIALSVLSIFLFSFLLNQGTRDHGYVLDDVSAITENWVVKKGVDELPTIWTTNYRHGYWSEAGSLYRPMTLSLFAWEWEHWPDDPGAAHMVNIVLYGLCCVALFLLLFLWFGSKDLWLPWIISMIFVSHPIHTEVVANIKSADELLASLFALIALIGMWKSKGKLTSLWMLLALGCFFIAVASKESAITLLPLVPMSVYFLSDLSWRKSLLPTLTLLAPFGVYLGLRNNALGSISGDVSAPMIDNVLIKAEGLEYLATVIKLGGLYLWKLVVPISLSHDYSFNQISISNFGDLQVLASLVVFAALFFFTYKAIRNRHVLGLASLFFLVTFSLYSNLFLMIGTHFGERLLFLPSIGFAMAIGWLIWKWGAKFGDRFEVAKALPALGVLVVILGLYSYKTIDRNKDWASEYDLYLADIKTAPNSSRTHYRLGMAYMKERAILEKNTEAKNIWLRKAVGELKTAIKIYPGYADAQGELGLAYQRLGYKDLAVERYEETLRLNPSHKTTLNNMGTVLFEQAKFELAIDYFLRALAKDPNYTDAIGNLASCYGTIGNYPDAIKWFKKAVDIDPRNASYYYFIGVTYQRMNNKKEADSWLLQAYTLDPSLRPKA